MKMLVAGVQRVKGTSKGGSAFDMCNLIALVAIEPFNNGKVNVSGTGFKPMELPCEESVLPLIAANKFPCVLDLNTEPRPRAGKLETVVVGFAPLPKAA